VMSYQPMAPPPPPAPATTTAPVVSTKIRPSAAWYWIGGVLIAAGVIGALVILGIWAARASDAVDNFARMKVVPGANQPGPGFNSIITTAVKRGRRKREQRRALAAASGFGTGYPGTYAPVPAAGPSWTSPPATTPGWGSPGAPEPPATPAPSPAPPATPTPSPPEPPPGTDDPWGPPRR